ncbi:MAG: amidophosphoribosyltransferase, partial [Nitrospinae bacterium]|nr:amidophosphoribosyltransferase [Nitrospinota bacterium]
TVDALRLWRQRHERLAAGSAWRDHQLVFTDQVGTPIKPDRMSRVFVRRVRKLDGQVSVIRLHGLRHTAGSHLIAAGVPVFVVSKILGHSSAAMTLDADHILPESYLERFGLSEFRPGQRDVVEAVEQVRGAYSLAIMSPSELIAVRDPYGFRPLCLGKLRDAYVLASETCALDLIEAEYVRDIEPGDVLVINEDGLTSHFPFPGVQHAQCIFEFVYFSRPDSMIFNRSVHEVRKALGQRLAKEAYVGVDVVVPVPDSGVPAALGYAEESGTPFDLALIRNHYVGRTFIEPQESIRHFGVKVKLNPIKRLLEGRRVVLIDDSIVRGTTSRKIVTMVRQAGAKEVHMRVSSPPITHPCFYGIDTPTREELIGSSHSVEETRKYITADSLEYLSLDGLLSTVHPNQNSYCRACFTGDYPVEIPLKGRPQVELFEEAPT